MIFHFQHRPPFLKMIYLYFVFIACVRVLKALEMELQTAVGCLVVARN